MRDPASTHTIIQGLTLGADSIAADWGGKRVAGFLFASPREGLEVFLRRNISLELCGALSSGAGSELLRWASRTPRLHLLRRETLRARVPAAHRAMAEDRLDGMALLPILGERSVLGYFLLACPEDAGFEDIESPEAMAALKAFNQWLDGMRHEAGLAALNGILGLHDRGLGEGIQGLLVLDTDDRILISHGMSRILPSWGGGEVMGQPVKTLPGGRVLASLDPVGSGHLDWRTRKVQTGKEARSLTVAALPLRNGDGERLPWRLLIIRGQDNQLSAQEGGLLLELALRLAPEEARGEEEGWARRADSLIPSALSAADRLQAEESVDLAGLFRVLLRRLGPELQDDRIRVLPFLNDELPMVRTQRRILDTALWAILQHVWVSLLPRGGTITLRTWEEEGSIWCTVSDDGAGGQGSQLPEAMDLGSGGSEDLREKGDLPQGGLEMTRALLKRAGGVFHMETRQGLWTRYSVVFPAERVVREARAHEAPGIPPAVEVRKIRNGRLAVLVVDDNQMVRTVLKRYLERSGHEVIEAVDGSVALEMANERAFDRVMVDIDMPGTSGVEFFQQLDSVNPLLRDRTVFMTGGFQEMETEDFIKSTGRPHLQKPFDLKEVGEVLST